MRKFAIIVAAGSGTRMGGDVPKQFLPLLDKPVLWHTLHAFLQAYADLEIILVLPDAHQSLGRSVAATLPCEDRVSMVTGGESRFHSVRNGVKALPEDESIVFVHDGVRCLATAALIHRCFEAALLQGNAIPAIASVDSVRIEEGGGNYVADRNRVRMIQTPQTFKSSILKKAFALPFDESFTDEASVVEKSGEKIQLVEGEVSNIKITRPIDLVVAATILEERRRLST